MAALRNIDDVAYVRFASVYRSFRDVSELMDELQALVEARGGPRKCASGRRPGRRRSTTPTGAACGGRWRGPAGAPGRRARTPWWGRWGCAADASWPRATTAGRARPTPRWAPWRRWGGLPRARPSTS